MGKKCSKKQIRNGNYRRSTSKKEEQIVAAPQDTNTTTNIATQENNNGILSSHKSIFQTAVTVGSTVGSTVGYYVGRVYAPIIAEQVSNRVEETVKATGDRLVEEGIKEAGLNGVPFLTNALKTALEAEVTHAAHEAGNIAYNQTMDVVPSKTALGGAVVTTIGTVLLLEAGKMLSNAYGNYKKNGFDAKIEKTAELEKAQEEYNRQFKSELADDFVLVTENQSPVVDIPEENDLLAITDGCQPTVTDIDEDESQPLVKSNYKL